MYHFYLDDTEKGMPGEGFLPILGGFIVKLSDYYELEKELQDLKENFGLNRFDPIKWSPGQTSCTYENQRKINDQNSFRRAILELLARKNITIIVAVIDEDSLIRKRDLKYYRSQALECLCQRFQFFLQENEERDIGQIILDYPGQKTESFLSKYYRDICCFGCRHIQMKLPLLSKTLYLAHAFSCEGLQLADYIVGTIGYTTKNEDQRYFELVKSRVRVYRGNIKGAGLIIFPSNSRRIDFLF